MSLGLGDRKLNAMGPSSVVIYMRLLAILFSFSALFAQQSQTVLKHTFDSGTEGWIMMGQNGSVKTSSEAKAGAGALAFTYSLDAKGLSTAILPAGAGNLSSLGRIRFWIKADHDTSIAIILSEKKPSGGDYAAMFHAPKNVWQQVELALAEFSANDGPNDPVDSDGKLDPDQIEGIGFIDLAGFFNDLPEESPMVVARKTGMHTLLIDEFEVLRGAAAKPGQAKPGGVLNDGFDRGYSPWVTMGGMSLAPAAPADNPLGAPALMASMKAVSGKLPILMRRTNGAGLAGTKRIAFDLASEHETTLALSIETKKAGSSQGPRYNFMVYPPEGRKVFRVDVSLADFEHDANSPEDPAGRIDASLIKSIAIGDISGLLGGAVADNKIWIGRIEMIK